MALGEFEGPVFGPANEMRGDKSATIGNLNQIAGLNVLSKKGSTCGSDPARGVLNLIASGTFSHRECEDKVLA